MIIESNVKSNIQKELITSKSVWIASAMITYKGWCFLQKNIPPTAIQYYLIGVDLATEPKVFDSILENLEINARVYETAYTFHPKVYLIQKQDDTFTAFIGSSNTTSWGLEKNVEMIFQIQDQKECKKLLNWFYKLYQEGYLVTQEFVDDYKNKFVKTSVKSKQIQNEALTINKTLAKNKGQFFLKNHHDVFQQKYHRINSESLKQIRKEVSGKFKELHHIIYPQFADFGLIDLHCHHNKSEIVSRHFFNQYSGNYINAMWLHYGKSQDELSKYNTGDTSTNRPNSFINNIRIQVIIHENSIGIWLVLGRSNGSRIDREYFKNQMTNPIFQKTFYDNLKCLGNDYWIQTDDRFYVKDVNTSFDLFKITQQERIEEYFIIGCDIDWLDAKLSSKNISNTVLQEFKKLYALYEIMKHK